MSLQEFAPFALNEKIVYDEIRDCPWDPDSLTNWDQCYTDVLIEWPEDTSTMHAATRSVEKGWRKLHVTPDWAKFFLPERPNVSLIECVPPPTPPPHPVFSWSIGAGGLLLHF